MIALQKWLRLKMLRESEEELAVTMEQLNAKDALKKVQDDLAELNQNLADAENVRTT